MVRSQLLRDYILLHLKLISIIKRWQPRYQLIEQDSQTVEIQRQPIALILQDLWTEVLWAAAYCLGLVIVGEVLLRKAEVGQLEVTPLIDEDIFRL